MSGKKLNEYPAQRRASSGSSGTGSHDTFAVGTARPPKHLDKEAKRIFRMLAARLSLAGVLRDVDEFALGEYCQAASDVISLTIEIRKKGETYDGPNGGVVHNPKLGLLKDARRRVKEYLDRLGLHPKARAALRFPRGGAAPGDRVPDDELEAFLSGRGWNRPDEPEAPAAPIPVHGPPSGPLPPATAREAS